MPNYTEAAHVSTDEQERSTLDSVLKATESLFLQNGFDGVSLEDVASKSGISHNEVRELYPSELDALVAMMNREFMTMYQGIINDVERDPLGGLLSRMYTYILSQVYERPVARSLFMIERSALHTLMRHQHAMMYLPTVQFRRELVAELQRVGMVRPECDPTLVSETLTVMSGGLALTAPHPQLDLIVESLMEMFGRKYDADVTDTEVGKRVFSSWAARLDGPSAT